MSTVSIIGAGSVGSTIAFALVLKNTVSKVQLCDINKAKCDAEVLDLSDTASDTAVASVDFKQAGRADLIIITAGAKQRPGETRLDLIARNYEILKSCITEMSPLNPKTIILLVANPVDILTYFAQKISSLPKNQVIGSGTFLDTSRLRQYLSMSLGVAKSAIHASVLGEHGDSQFVAWDSARCSGIPLLKLVKEKGIDMKKCEDYVKNKAYTIIESKGSTFYGIAGIVCSIAETIFLNTLQVRPLSHYVPDLEVCLSLPAVLGRNGIVNTLAPALSDQEGEHLKKSAKGMKEVISQYDF